MGEVILIQDIGSIYCETLRQKD